MTKTEQFIPSSDGVHSLHTIVFLPEGEARGMVQIVHGMAEYAARYEPFMQLLAENGYIAFAHDHLGHGQSVKSEDELGFIAPKDGWKILIEDVDRVAKAMEAAHPGKKRILFGHSMGSFIVRLYCAQHGGELAGLIVMGTGGKNAAAGAGIAVAKLIGAVCGKRHVSALVNSLAFGAYNDRTEKRTALDWLSVDTENVDRYIADPLCGFPFTVSAMADLVTMNKNSNEDAAFAVPASLPIFLVAGAEDPVGAYGAGPEEVAERYRAAGVSDVRCKLYPGARHELLNEFCSAEVKADLLSWLNERY